jgi:multiple antibiotic resistance protein
LGKHEVKRQRRIIFRELVIALFILLLFNFFGENLLDVLGISQPVIGMAGGMLLLIIALSMIFPKISEKKHNELRPDEPLIVPLAIPIIAGPGAIATVMIFAEQIDNPWMMMCIIMTAWLPSLFILLAASNLKRFLGQRGLLACQKLGGMLILLFAVQMTMSGLMVLLRQTIHEGIRG